MSPLFLCWLSVEFLIDQEFKDSPFFFTARRTWIGRVNQYRENIEQTPNVLATKQITHAEFTAEIQFHNAATVPGSILHRSMHQIGFLCVLVWVYASAILNECLTKLIRNSWISSFKQILAWVLLKWNVRCCCAYAVCSLCVHSSTALMSLCWMHKQILKVFSSLCSLVLIFPSEIPHSTTILWHTKLSNQLSAPLFALELC